MDPASPTYVLTDVVGSTQLAAQLGALQSGRLWRSHDELMRMLLAQCNGTELERTDGVSATFETPMDALRFAHGYLKHLVTLDPPLLARVAVHQGGPSVMQAMLSLAPGGRILASRDTMPYPIPEGLGRATAQGSWVLEEGAEPLALVELHAPTDPSSTLDDNGPMHRVVRQGDAWLPVRDIPRTLPAEWDPFVGRRVELDAIAQFLDRGARLVTVTGPGGCGKTRLVTRFGWQHLGDYDGGVWFSDLSEARDRSRIVYAVAGTLDAQVGGEDPESQIVDAIRKRGRCLVVLDNFEQVVDHAQTTLQRWLAEAPQATFVVTSREVLGLPGEAILPVDALEESDAVRLFATRAAASTGGMFMCSPDNAADVVALVRLLDQLPLAIELAAARVRLLTPRALLDRMAQRFGLLTGGQRPGRQATLQATFDWSWDLLDTYEQSGFAQLSVFEGGFTMDAAEAVVRVGDAWPMDVVQSLVDKSLVRKVTDRRFTLLASAQVYAAGKLSAELRTAAEQRHGTHYATFGDPEALAAARRHGGATHIVARAAELDNIVAACRRAVSRSDEDIAIRTLRAAGTALEMRGPTALSAALAAEVSDMPTLGAAALAAARVVQGHAAWRLGDLDEAIGHYTAALAHHETSGDDAGQANMLNNIGDVHRTRGNLDEANTYLERARAQFRSLGEEGNEAAVLGNLASLAFMQGHHDLAVERFETALAIHRKVGDRQHEGLILGNLGYVQFYNGQFAAARTSQTQALAVFQEIGLVRLEGHTLCLLGQLDAEEGDHEQAFARYEEGLAIVRRVGHRRFEGVILGHQADLHRMQGNYDRAHDLYNEALQVHEGTGASAFEDQILLSLGNLYREWGDLERAESHYALALESQRTADNPRGVGFAIACQGTLAALRGHADTARALWDESEQLLRECGDRLALAKMLAERAGHEGEWSPDAARTHLAEAEAIAVELAVAPRGVLGSLISEARAVLAQGPAALQQDG